MNIVLSGRCDGVTPKLHYPEINIILLEYTLWKILKQNTAMKQYRSKAYSQEAFQDAKAELDKLQAFLDAIVFITDGESDKIGGTLYFLARESATLCTTVHEMLNQPTPDKKTKAR